MNKPASYPFLAIARKYGLDYGDVLIYADIHNNGNIAPRTFWYEQAINNVSAIESDYAAVQDIFNALEQFRAIQAGLIDWNTGEPNFTGPLRIPLLDAETLKPIPGTGGVDLGEPVPNYLKCDACNGTGWLGHGMGDCPCTVCAGNGRTYIADKTSPYVPGTPEEPEPGEHAEIIHALDYRNHDDDNV